MAPGAVTALGEAAKGVAEVFVPSATKRLELSAEAQMAALQQLGEEYQHPSLGWFDRMVNGLNRLPRPMLAFGTLGLFTYAMVDPEAFAHRMVGLNAVPEPLWWLLGGDRGLLFRGARDALFPQPDGGFALCGLKPAGVVRGERGAGGLAAGVI